MSHRPSANAHYYCQILASILASLIVLATSPTAKAQFSTTLNIPPDSVPAAVSSNTQLNVLPGGSIGDDFTIGASNGSTSNVELNVLGGFVGARLTARSGSRVNLSTGTIDRFRVEGGTATINGGTAIGRVLALSNGHITISGGKVLNTTFGGLEIFDAQLDMTGGEVGEGFEVKDPAAVANISGGRFGPRFKSFSGRVNLFGGDFELNGVPIAGLSNAGDSVQFNLPANSVLSGTLQDGTTFSLNLYALVYESDVIAPGTLYLHAVNLPSAPPAVIDVPAMPAPDGARSGQTINVNGGGALGPSFSAAPGSIVNVAGGLVEFNLEAIDATVNVFAGEAQTITALLGSNINVFGGQVGEITTAGGATARISGGDVVDDVLAANDGNIVVSGGAVRRLSARDGRVEVTAGTVTDAYAGPGGEFIISGGAFANRVQIDAGASLMLSGGLLAQSLRARSGASVAIIGSDFALDGAPITGLTPGQPYLVTQTNATLSGVLSDGSPFAVALAPQLDRGGGPLGIDPNAVLTVTLVPEPRAAASVLTAVLGACLMSRPRFRRRRGISAGGTGWRLRLPVSPKRREVWRDSMGTPLAAAPLR